MHCKGCNRYIPVRLRDDIPLCFDCDDKFGLYKFRNGRFHCNLCNQVKNGQVILYTCLHKLCASCLNRRLIYNKPRCNECKNDERCCLII